MMNTTQGNKEQSSDMPTTVSMSAVSWEQKPGKRISSGSEVKLQTVGFLSQPLGDVGNTSQSSTSDGMSELCQQDKRQLVNYVDEFPVLTNKKQSKKMTLHAKNMAGQLISLVVQKDASWMNLHSKLSKIVQPFESKMLKVFPLSDDDRVYEEFEFMRSSVNLTDGAMFGYILNEPKSKIDSSCRVHYSSDDRKHEEPLYFCSFIVFIEDKTLFEIEFTYRITDNKFFTQNDIQEDEPIHDRRRNTWYTPWFLTGNGYNSLKEVIEHQTKDLGAKMKILMSNNYNKAWCDFLQQISEKTRLEFPDEKLIAIQRLTELQ
jgi:hypothetical protein